MAKFRNPITGQIEEIGNPELNPELISGKTKVPDTTPLGILTSDDLKPAPEFTPATPQTPITPDISKLDTSFIPQTLGTEGKKAQDFSEEIRKINESFLGRTAFKQEQEKAVGIPEIERTQQDLTSQLKMFQNEMLDLQNQRTTIESKMQEQAFGRGITTAGLAPLTAGELRKNQIQQATVASKALTTSSILEAVKGNLITAQNIADRAFALKYGALEEEQKIKLANLDLLLKSPALTLEDKNRAEQRKIIEANRLRNIEEKKQTDKDIQSEVFKAIKNGLQNANTINKMQNSKTAIEAAGIAAEAGFGINVEEKRKFEETQKLTREKIAEDRRQMNIKFEEDKRQFGLNYALKQKELKLKEIESGTGGLTADNWAKLIISGQAKITDVPNPRGSTLRSQVIDIISNSGQLLLSDKDREKLSTLDTAFNVANTIKELSQKINTFGVGKRITGFLSRKASEKLQTNTDIARYKAAREGFVSNVARTLGEKGTLAEGDVQRAISNLPTINDTKAVAEGKLNTLFKILEGAKSSIIQKSTEPLNKTTEGTLNLQPEDLRTKYNY